MPNDLRSDPGVAYSCGTLSYYSIVFAFLDELIWIGVVCDWFSGVLTKLVVALTFTVYLTLLV